jgi:predicted Fe-Mo cluster-binding NifX family protein
MKIAVASKSGTKIDQHFGHAERFLIYDYSDGDVRKISEVAIEKYCQFDPENPFRHPQFDGIVSALDGCQAVVTVQIGQLPREQLLKKNIVPITTTAAIDDAVKMAYEVVSKVTKN